jgi:hypothetical protein
MGFLAEWRATRERRRLAENYLRRVLIPADGGEVEWLAAVAGSRPTAERELVFAKRAIGLIVAERDALDDRTASDVVHALAPVVEGEARTSPEHGRQWLARRREYAAALATRGQTDAPAVRLARVLLAGAGRQDPSPDVLTRATSLVLAERARANDALRQVFGEASLPDDVRPSAMRP